MTPDKILALTGRSRNMNSNYEVPKRSRGWGVESSLCKFLKRLKETSYLAFTNEWCPFKICMEKIFCSSDSVISQIRSVIIRDRRKTLPKAQRTRGLSSYHKFHTNLDQISILESRLNINFEISTKHQHVD